MYSLSDTQTRATKHLLFDLKAGKHQRVSSRTCSMALFILSRMQRTGEADSIDRKYPLALYKHQVCTDGQHLHIMSTLHHICVPIHTDPLFGKLQEEESGTANKPK